MKKQIAIIVVVLSLVLVGCTSTNPKAALDDVNKTVMTRTGQQTAGMSSEAVNVLLQTNLRSEGVV